MARDVNLPEHESAFLDVGDVKIHYRSFGQPGATPVLIVHGLSFFSYDWIDIATSLSRDRQVVAMDMRGFGDSSWSPDQDYSMDAFANDIDALLTHLTWERAVLMGHSMGGRNVTYYSSLHPERVERLILVDFSPVNAKQGARRITNIVADMPDAFETVDEAISYFGADPQDAKTRARYEAYLKKTDDGFIVKRDDIFRQRFIKMRETGQRAQTRADMWEVLAEVGCPILIVRGKRSDMFAAENVDKVKAANERVKLVEVDTGHNVPGEDPEGLLREAVGFLN